MTERYGSVVIEVVTRLNLPLMQLFALYVIAHGHYSPGGGFQGGVILAVSVVLHRLVLGREESGRRFPSRTALFLAATGVLAFFLIGLLPLLAGSGFLDYAALPLPGVDPVTRRYLGILAVEVAIGLGVWGALVSVFDRLTGAPPPR